jgi:transglutaminase-like putative cysteine protease
MVPLGRQALTDPAVGAFLEPSLVVDTADAAIAALARQLSRGRHSDVEIARACYEWVRDRVAHTGDARHQRVTCAAADVLSARSGYCYAKSHLLAALLRANGIPAGFVYQRLAIDERGTAFCLHGLNAIRLEAYGWYRVDARGNRGGMSARFDPPHEALAFVPSIAGERLIAGVAAVPLACVVTALQSHPTRADFEAHLPDLDVADLAELMPAVPFEPLPLR